MTRTLKVLAAAAICAGALLQAPLFAHHSFAMYDQNKTVTITGVVKQYVPQATHAEFPLYVIAPDRKRLEKGKDGKPLEFMVEMAGTPQCERAAEAPTSAATKIDGVWRMDTDPSAARLKNSPENWGHWIYVFDRGRFAITQENQDACTWGYGKIGVDGNRMSWTFTDGGGIAPSGAANRPGEFFVFDFSAYRDTLTVTPVKGEISPDNFRDKPWRRLSDTPSRRYFSKRCPPPPAALRD